MAHSPEHMLDLMQLMEEDLEDLEKQRLREKKKKTSIMLRRMCRHQEVMRSAKSKRQKIHASNDTICKLLSPLESLPDEILHLVLRSLSLPSLLSFSECSKRTLNITHDESLWQNLCEARWGQLAPTDLYKDLFDGTTVLWTVTYRKKYNKEMWMKKKTEREQHLKHLSLIECKYCQQEKACIVERLNSTR